MRNKKSYFCDYKKRAELYNNWIALYNFAKYFFPSKMTFMVDLTAQKIRVTKLILIFDTAGDNGLKKSFLLLSTPALLNKSLKVKKWYESSV